VKADADDEARQADERLGKLPSLISGSFRRNPASTIICSQ